MTNIFVSFPRHMKRKHPDQNDVEDDLEVAPGVTEYDEVTEDTEYAPEGSAGSDNEVAEVDESGLLSPLKSGRYKCQYCDLDYAKRWSVGR